MYLKAVYESFIRAAIRFFDNRFLQDNEVEWYRIELDKLRIENQRLVNVIIQMNRPESASPVQNDETEWKPLVGFETVSQKRRRLERESYNRLQSNIAQAREETSRKAAQAMTTEQLEEELGVKLGS